MADQASLRPAGPAHSRRELTTLRPKEASDRIIHGRLASVAPEPLQRAITAAPNAPLVAAIRAIDLPAIGESEAGQHDGGGDDKRADHAAG